MARVKVGDTSDADYQGAHQSTIENALSDGHRHLVITSPNITFDTGINLGNFPNKKLTIEGGSVAGLGGTTFNVVSDWIAAFWAAAESYEDTWHLRFLGINFDGWDANNERGHLGSSALNFGSLDRSLFVSCAFRRFGHSGVVFGANGPHERAIDSHFLRCEFERNDHIGAFFKNPWGLSFQSCFFHRNSPEPQHAGLFLTAPESAKTGFASIFDCRFEADEQVRGLFLENQAMVRVRDNQFSNSCVAFSSGTERAYVGWNVFFMVGPSGSLPPNAEWCWPGGAGDAPGTGHLFEQNFRYD